MNYTLDGIKRDLIELDVKSFYKKYIIKSDNWYFRNVLRLSESSIIDALDNFRDIVSSCIDVSFYSVLMVGSGKIGYSLSKTKKLKEFEQETNSRRKSDIDIAIISCEIFDHFWKLFRQSYSVKFKIIYEEHIFREIYRGYINDRNLYEIGQCRLEWSELSNRCSKTLKSDLYFKHEISYRIYRRWEDFEEYNIQSIQEMMDEVSKSGF